MRVHLETVWKQTGEKPKELDFEPCPVVMLYLWEDFKELELGRQFNELGKLPFSYSEIESWCRLTKRELTNFDLRILKQLDLISLKRKDE